MADDLHRRHTLRKSQLIDFPNVAAGHEGVKASRSGDLIVKPCKNAEVHFYQQNWTPDPDTSDIAYYMPKFFGTLNLQENPPATAPLAGSQPRPDTATSSTSHTRTASSRPVISHLPVSESLAPTKPPKKWEPSKGAKIDAENSVVLENVASGLVKPNILDIKLGARLWADDAAPDKRERLDQVAATTTSGPLGFRIAGMKIWAGDGAYRAWEMENRERMDKQDASTSTSGLDAHSLPRPALREDDYASYDKEYGRALTTENVRRGFEEYFYRPPATSVRKDQAQEVISRFVEDLKGLQEVMENQETRMYSASLLFVYEGSGAALKESFRRENRMYREAREQMEALKVARPSISSTTQHTASSTTVNSAPAAASSSMLPPITIDSSLEIPADLLLNDPTTASESLNADSDTSDSDASEDLSKLPKIQSLKVIDFAHATTAPGQGPDENFLKGVRSVIRILEEMLAD